MLKKCSKCEEFLYETQSDEQGISTLNKKFEDSIIQDKNGLFVECYNCKHRFPAVLINTDGINRISILDDNGTKNGNSY